MELLEKAISESGYNITGVVHGDCWTGVDRLADQWARDHLITPKPVPADWNDLSHPDAVIRINKRGQKYDAKAGHRRNKKMAEMKEIEAAIGLWDGRSPGTLDMKELCLEYSIPLFFKDLSK